MLSPPQARHVERPQPKHLGKVSKLVEAKWLHKNVDYLLISADVSHINFAVENAFSDKVVVHFDMFCAEFLAIWMVLRLSQCTSIGSEIVTRKSFSRRLSHITAEVSSTTALYSASVLDSVTVDCFLLLHEIAALLRWNMNPDVDLRSIASPAQSASV